MTSILRYTFGVAFRVAVMGKDRNFIFGTEVDHVKSSIRVTRNPKGNGRVTNFCL